jgi:hypothetical protein
MTATTRTAITDALTGRAGVIRDVQRDEEPDIPEAVESELQASARDLEPSGAAPAQRSL